MNQLVKHRIEMFMKKYFDGRFDQDDVMLLLIDLRDTSEFDSLTRELGDFFAHPHGRTKGLTWKVIENSYRKVEESFDSIFSGKLDIEVSPLCTEIDIINSVSQSIELTGVDSGVMKKPLNDNRAKDFILCIIGLLSSFSILIKNKPNALNISLGRDGTHLTISANIKITKDGRTISLNWPILSTSCQVHNDCLSSVFPWSDLSGFVARRMEDGTLSICRLETDKGLT